MWSVDLFFMLNDCIINHSKHYTPNEIAASEVGDFGCPGTIKACSLVWQ